MALTQKRKEIQAHIGSLEQGLEQARRDLSAIVATEHVFLARGPNITAYMHLAYLFPRLELPRCETRWMISKCATTQRKR